jgi:hypothetical protein
MHCPGELGLYCSSTFTVRTGAQVTVVANCIFSNRVKPARVFMKSMSD